MNKSYDKNDIDSIIWFSNNMNNLIFNKHIRYNEKYNWKIIVPDASFLIKWLIDESQIVNKNEDDRKRNERVLVQSNSEMLLDIIKRNNIYMVAPHILYTEMSFIKNEKRISDIDFLIYMNELYNNYNLKHYCWDYRSLKSKILEISKSRHKDESRWAELTDCTYQAVSNILGCYFVTADKVHYGKISDQYQDETIPLQEMNSNKVASLLI